VALIPMPDVTLLFETLQFEVDPKPFSIIVEPWAVPVFEVRPGERCSIIVHHPTLLPTVTCSVIGGVQYVLVHGSGSTFSFVRQGVVEFSVPQRLALP
jgi:hypothetical protein